MYCRFSWRYVQDMMCIIHGHGAILPQLHLTGGAVVQGFPYKKHKERGSMQFQYSLCACSQSSKRCYSTRLHVWQGMLQDRQRIRDEDNNIDVSEAEDSPWNSLGWPFSLRIILSPSSAPIGTMTLTLRSVSPRAATRIFRLHRGSCQADGRWRMSKEVMD